MDKSFWICLGVVIGVVAISIAILIWIIKTSTKLIVLKNSVDRNFPVINGKIKQYCEVAELLVKTTEKKMGSKTKEGDSILKGILLCVSNDSMIERAKLQKGLSKKIDKYLEKNKEQFKTSTKIQEIIKQIQAINEGLILAIDKYNEAAISYNRKIKTLPAKMVAERYKFVEKTLWKF